MPSPFDYVNAINTSKTNAILSGELPPEGYNAFLTNRALSYHADSVHAADEMNVRPNVPGKWQFHFFNGILPKRKRYSKWAKQKQINDKYVTAYAELFEVSFVKASEEVALLEEQQKEELLSATFKGGR